MVSICDLDCRTPVEQVKEIMKGFSNAEHEQGMWEKETFDEIIPMFLLCKKVENTKTYYSDLKFILLTEKTKGHPSIR